MHLKVSNLKHQDYLELLCESIPNLVTLLKVFKIAFSQLNFFNYFSNSIAIFRKMDLKTN